jgi:hypothetical protein
MATVARAAHQVKSNVTQFLPEHVIRDAAAAVGHRWRERKLGPARAVLLLVLQLLSANASLAHARALDGYAFVPSALCQARGRLPLALLRRVLDWLVWQAAGGGPGPRVVLVDAFNCLAPDACELRRRYGRPRQQRSGRGCDYPQVRTVAVFDLRTGVLLAQHHFRSDRHESPVLRRVLGVLRPGDVAVFDRGFVGYANLCLLRAAGVHVVARLAAGLLARRGTRRTRVARLGKGDLLVRWGKPARRPPGTPALAPRRWAALPAELRLRQVTVAVNAGRSRSRSRRVTLVTDLTDPAAHPAATVAAWYRRRWEVETDVRHLKRTMNLEFLRARTPATVERELLLRAIAYNLVRLAMLRSAEMRGIGDDPGRVSFTDACRWLTLTQGHAGGGAGAGAGASSLLKLLTNAARQRRPRPRKLKYRGKNYGPLTTRPAPQKRVA